uniref:Uncharacterized protein n=1 Tax=Magallana gigas TaxID=29159 RepID=K1QND3_MAGGI
MLYIQISLIVPSILANDVQLTYLENDATFITGTSPKVGSNANLGIYPHWCLGNINKCSDGITVSFFIKPKKADETSPEAVIITSGGHSFFSEGFYLLQKYGDQYEFGVSKQDKLWRQKFRLLPNLWTNIFASWNDSAGLKLYVDGYLMKRDDPEKREYEDDSFDPFSEIVIGLDQEGLPINSTNLFDIDNLVIFNSIKTPQEYSIEGVFTITISTTIGDIHLSKTVDFEVKDVDEGIPPEMSVVSANHLQVQLSAEYQLLSFGEYDTECSVRYGDGNIFHQSHKSGYLNALIHGSKSYLENLNIFRNDVQELNSTVQANGILINSFDLQPYENLVTIKNGDITLIKRIFYVQHLVQKATITPIKRSNAWYLTTNITIEIPAGLETFINCSFGIGDSYMFYIDKSDVPLGMLFEVEYPSLGYYPVIVDMTNDISTSRKEDLISVEVPIVTIKLSTSNITDKTLPVILKVDLNGDSPGPDKVEFNIRHGDGHADDVSYRKLNHNNHNTNYDGTNNYSRCRK